MLQRWLIDFSFELFFIQMMVSVRSNLQPKSKTNVKKNVKKLLFLG